MMKFLIPTAKEMTLSQQTYPVVYSEKSQKIIETLSHYTVDELTTLFKISPQVASREYERIHKMAEHQAVGYRAIELFNGLMYRNITRTNLSNDAWHYLSTRVFITSALFGIISCDSIIPPHRLDFNTALSIDDTSLKNYWRADFDDFLHSEMQTSIISLLSSEFETVFSPSLRKKVIRIVFMEEINGKLKTHSTISKKARGQFLSQAILNQSNTVDELLSLTWEQFAYNEAHSTDTLLVWTRTNTV